MQPQTPLSIIVAIAENNAIGYKNQLLCYLPDDLKYFKRITQGKTVIMGKNTWFSLPVRPLPGRRNLVLTDLPEEKIPGAETVYSLKEAMEKADPDEENFIIGGGSIYRQFLPYAQKLYITHVLHSFQADTYFEPIDPKEWEQISFERHPRNEKNAYDFAFAVYRRRLEIEDPNAR